MLTGNYEVISGVCVGLGHAGLKRYRKVRMLLTDGTECEVALDKRISLRIGNCYQLYFRTTHDSEKVSLPGQALMDSQFLVFQIWVSTIVTKILNATCRKQSSLDVFYL